MRFLSPITSTSFCVATLFSANAAARILQAEISAGQVQGGLCSQNNKDGPSKFLGIPYAIPPVGERRWLAPGRYNDKFSGGKLSATKFAAVCYQFSWHNGSAADPPPYSEDCLYLNVWVPSTASTSSPDLPVKVWIHGGANNGGSIVNPLYDGCDLAATGSIVVNIAYRLGPLGFLALKRAGISGNFGIQDIKLGLQWVQDNIAAFGGDRRKVLLFGQSAGAWNSFIISTLPDAKNLMRAVALESGGGIDLPSSSSAQMAGAMFAKRANCSANDAACLRSISPGTLRDIFWDHSYSSLRTMSITRPCIQPYVDGAIIPEQPSQAGVQVPAVFGSMSQEGTIAILNAIHHPEKTKPSRYHDILTSGLGPLVDEVYAQYPLSSFSNHPYPDFSRAAQIITDWQWRCPSYRGLLRAGEKGIPTWTYLFDHSPKCPSSAGMGADVAALLGPSHTFDIPFVLAHTSSLPRPNGACSFDATELRISQTFVDAWTGLAATGDASTATFNWPAFENGTSMGLYVGDDGAAIRSLQANFSVCSFWNHIQEVLLQAANTGSTRTTVIATGEAVRPQSTVTGALVVVVHILASVLLSVIFLAD
ncbi:Cholinesterase [Drechslerella dactyloides]|uniref:Carboxylic ester hydrolase n=1 Tax=Drechslerella dactyloides TaxID=74499 RepID=A0AAD6IWD4_DREDA|nr:Cholinesterase [Drechslerella dactyloides]